MEEKHANSKSNSNLKNKKKKRNRRNRNRKSSHNADEEKTQIENPTVIQPTSGSRPINLFSNNFNSDNKRCSGSEIEEFHTPNGEYSDISSQEYYDKEWREIGIFSKSNLEGIPEKDHNLKPANLSTITNGQQLCGKELEILGDKSFKYKQITNGKKHKKCNGDVRNKDQHEKPIIEVANIINETKNIDATNDGETRPDGNDLTDLCMDTLADPGILDDSSTMPPILDKDDTPNVMQELKTEILDINEKITDVAHSDHKDLENCVVSLYETMTPVGALPDKDLMIQPESNENNLSSKIEEDDEFDVYEDALETFVYDKLEYCRSNDENIHCIDENLEETLRAPIIQMNVQFKTTIKKSLTLGAKDLSSPHRQSATTITNVTSISDEHLNLSHEKLKREKKGSKFWRNFLSKFKKPKQNVKTEEIEKKLEENPLPANNEYFDDASIDCNSHGKSCEVDSNKALQSYDELTNPFEETKQIDNEYVEDYILNADVEQVDDACQTDNVEEESIHLVESPEIPIDGSHSDGEKAHSIKSSERENTLEKSKKKKVFTLFSIKKNKTSPKLKLIDITNQQPRKNYNCSENKTETTEVEDKTSLVIIENDDKLESPLEEMVHISIPIPESNENIRRSSIPEEDENINDLENNLEDEKVQVEQPIGDTDITPLNPIVEFPVKSPDNISEENPSVTVVKKSKKNKSKKKHKNKLLPLFSNKKFKPPKIQTEISPGDKLLDKTLASEDSKVEIDEECMNEFNKVVQSLDSVLNKEMERVISKNQNDYPTSLDTGSILEEASPSDNDDHMFPDALTPTKLLQFNLKDVYNFPFIDDPVVIKQDGMTLFRGESKRPLLFTEFSAPFASTETLFVSENSYGIKMPDNSLSPTRKNKRPFSGLMSFISRSR